MLVIAGTASQRLSHAIAAGLHAPLARTEIKRFPDGECYVRILDPLKGEVALVVQNSYPDHNIIELFLLQDAARRAGAGRIITLIPYFGYARQDKLFLPGQAVSALALARHIEMDADAIITVDIHNPETMAAFSKPAVNASAMPAVGQFLRGKVDLLLSPDKGSVERVRLAAEIAGLPFDHLEKTRTDPSTVQIAPKKLDVAGKRVGVVDDVIATGGTMIKAAEHLRAQGASQICAACTHGLFSSGALERLRSAFDAVYACDTIETEASVISAAQPLVRYIREI
ncbi:MAG: ribose-phosphate diphosphokinase [Candidatus Thermoplasmatota archaeon]